MGTLLDHNYGSAIAFGIAEQSILKGIDAKLKTVIIPYDTRSGIQGVEMGQD